MTNEELQILIGMKRIALDDIIPDGLSHMIYIPNPLDDELKFVAVSVTGTQWDFLWWMYRLQDTPEKFRDWIGSFMNSLGNPKI